MLINTKDLKRVCAAILPTVSSSEAIELSAKDRVLTLRVSTSNYCLATRLSIGEDEEIVATINAAKFLKLIGSISDDVESTKITVTNNYVSVKANNSYKIALETLSMNAIDIANPTLSMTIDGDVLNNVLAYNSHELSKYSNVSSAIKPVQTMYYLDQEGCITFTDGACVNSFKLEKPIRLLLDQNIVRLFKLFKGDSVKFTLGYDPISETLIQTKVRFESPSIELTAITACSSALIDQVPVNAIRSVATKSYFNSVVVDKNLMLQAIGRLLLFATTKAEADFAVGAFSIDQDGVKISWNDNEDFVKAEVGSEIRSDYKFFGMIKDIKETLETVIEQFVTINYGDGKAIVVVHKGGAVRNVIPEVEDM